MTQKIFFSWQSDIKGAACRSLIQGALEAAAKQLKSDGSLLVEPVIDRDTSGVAGSPDIGATILSKIEAADAFVADVTIINSANEGRRCPNPNVLVEVGYALKALGDSRIILVQNTAFGRPEDLPFDLRRKRVLTFCSDENAGERAGERAALTKVLKDAVLSILQVPKPNAEPVSLTVDSKKLAGSDGDIHHYQLQIVAENHSDLRIDDWQLEFDFPTPFLERGVTVGCMVKERSGPTASFFRVDGRELMTPIYPGNKTRDFGLAFYVDHELFHLAEHLFSTPVTARMLVDGKVAGKVTKPLRDLQNF